MRRRIRIAFANCQAASPVAERVAARFTALADVRVYPTAADGTDLEAAIQAIAEAAPDVVIALPKPAVRLAARMDAPVVRLEFPARVVLARIEEALRRAEPIAVLPPAGTIAPVLAARIRLWRGSVFLLPYEDRRHLRTLVARCRRMGVKGLVGVSLNDRPEEPNGVMSEVIVRAATRVAPQVADGLEEMPVVRAVLRTIARGGLRPGDTAIGLDRKGRVTTFFAAPARPEAGEPPAVPPRTSLLEAVAALTGQAGSAGGDPDALAMDLYPLGRTAAQGYLAVLHGAPRRPVGRAGTAPALRDATADGDRFTRLLEEIGRLAHRSAN